MILFHKLTHVSLIHFTITVFVFDIVRSGGNRWTFDRRRMSIYMIYDILYNIVCDIKDLHRYRGENFDIEEKASISNKKHSISYTIFKFDTLCQPDIAPISGLDTRYRIKNLRYRYTIFKFTNLYQI